MLGHLLDSRYYRTHDDPGRPAPAGKFSAKRRGYVVSHGSGPRRPEDLGLDSHHPRVLRSGALLGALPGGGCSRAARPCLGHAPPLSDQLAGARRRGPRQPGRRAPLQGLQRAAHAQRRAGRGRFDLAVPARVRLRPRRRVDGGGRRTLRGRLALRPQGAYRHRVRRLPDRLHASGARAVHRRGLADRLADHRYRPRGCRDGAARPLRPARPELRAAHADRPLQVHDRRVAAGRRRGRRTAGRCDRPRPAPGRLSREHGHQVPAAPRARRVGRHRPRRRTGGGQRQRGQDRRRHAARAAPPGRAGRRRPRPALQHAARRQPGTRRVRWGGRGLPDPGLRRGLHHRQPLRRARRGGAGGPQGVACPPAPPGGRRPRLALLRR